MQSSNKSCLYCSWDLPAKVFRTLHMDILHCREPSSEFIGALQQFLQQLLFWCNSTSILQCSFRFLQRQRRLCTYVRTYASTGGCRRLRSLSVVRGSHREGGKLPLERDIKPAFLFSSVLEVSPGKSGMHQSSTLSQISISSLINATL